MIDIGLFFVGHRFGDNEWEFATIIQVIDALPVSMMAVLLLAIGARISGKQTFARVIAVLCALAALLMVAMLLLFALDVPVANQALQRALAAGAGQNAEVVTMIKRGIVKTFILGAGYLAAFVGLTIIMWKRPRTGAAQAEAG